MKAIIMAGGKGTRLMPLTNSIPKPMVNIIDKPVLEYVINLCKNHGITEIGITLGYLPDAIVDYFGDGKKFGVNITYFFEDEPLGTAGGVKNAEGYLGEDFVVLSGDAYSEIDLTRAIEFHKQKESLFTIVATPHPNPVGYGIIELDFENRIKKFVEKPQVVYPSLINTGIYVPYDISSLLPGDVDCLERILYVKLVGIGDENGVQMAQRLASGDFRTLYKNETESVCSRLGYIV